jgi:Family of unknown function (DUF6101)
VTPPAVRDGMRIEAADPRSDNRRRVIEVAREAVNIRRTVAGVSMSIRIAARTFRGVTLRVTGLSDGCFRYEVSLLHPDPDLSVRLAEGEDQMAVEAQWREWVGFLRLPALVGRVDGCDVAVNIDTTDIALRIPSDRRRGRQLGPRRSRFLTRRKVGNPRDAKMLDSDPDVLFYGAGFDR